LQKAVRIVVESAAHDFTVRNLIREFVT